MVIKSSRIKCSTAINLVRHILDLKPAPENESVEEILGNRHLIDDFEATATAWGRMYSCRHIIVNPAVEMTINHLDTVLNVIEEEYPQISRERMFIVRHEKDKVGCDARLHYHIVVPEVDDSGRVLKSKFSKISDEFMGWMSALLLDHPPVNGAHTAAVHRRAKKNILG